MRGSNFTRYEKCYYFKAYGTLKFWIFTPLGARQTDRKMILNQKLLEGRDSICLTLEYLGIEDVDKYLLTECVQYKHS